VNYIFENRIPILARTLLTWVFLFAVDAPSYAATTVAPDFSNTCESAAKDASKATGVPIDVLRAISLTETGRKRNGKMRPWPWTVNMEGEGRWFDTEDEARAYVYGHYKRGARSFDVGCFQLNYKWHGKGFTSIEQMFDPIENAMYAARFLSDLHSETGNWVDAAGFYHSRTPKYANRYKERFRTFLARLGGADHIPDQVRKPMALAARQDVAQPEKDMSRINNFPLLTVGSGGAASLGSLMPSSHGSGSKRFIGLGAN
jgi:hypothetical protein